MDYLTRLTDMFPDCAPYAIEVERLRTEVERIPISGFFEPKVLLVAKGNDPAELLGLDAATLASWAAHVASGTRVRMRTLEDTVCQQLAEQRVIPAMALARAHLETAGFVSYGKERVAHCADVGNWDEMKRIIPRMLFGTSFKLEKKAKAFQELLDSSDQEPLRINAMIEAMDRFAEQTETPATHWFRVAYAILCEYTHPTMRSMRPFYEVTKEDPNGWHLQYSTKASVAEHEVTMALSILAESMRVGHSGALLLQSWQFKDGQEGILFRKTPIELGEWIWQAILHRPTDLPPLDFAYQG